MGREIDLLQSLPKGNRKLKERKRARTPDVIDQARKFGELYFDGPREYGYGGYYYDGRWQSVARQIVKQYNIASGMKILDIGCAKGFLLKDLKDQIPGLNVFGIDISSYAIKNCHPEVVGDVYVGDAKTLFFPDNSFDLVISINTLHNLYESEVLIALQEIERVSKKFSYIVVDSYRTEEERELFENWVLTANFHGYPQEWQHVFEKARYTGDYSWTIIN
jgi:ubiquinone/menaquinone biosynthesis C-methylase UbiE